MKQKTAGKCKCNTSTKGAPKDSARGFKDKKGKILKAKAKTGANKTKPVAAADKKKEDHRASATTQSQGPCKLPDLVLYVKVSKPPSDLEACHES